MGVFLPYAALILAFDSELLPEPNASNDVLSLVHGEKLAADAHKFLKLMDPVVAGRMPRPSPAAGAYFLFKFMLKNFSQRFFEGLLEPVRGQGGRGGNTPCTGHIQHSLTSRGKKHNATLGPENKRTQELLAMR